MLNPTSWICCPTVLLPTHEVSCTPGAKMETKKCKHHIKKNGNITLWIKILHLPHPFSSQSPVRGELQGLSAVQHSQFWQLWFIFGKQVLLKSLQSNGCDPTNPGWQKLCKGTKGLRQKVWSQTKILSPKIRYFGAMLRFIAIYAFLEIFGQKMWVFLDKNSVS